MCLKVCRDLYTYATDEPADGDLAPGYASCNAMKKTLNCTIADSSCAVRSDVAAGAAGRSGCHPFRQQQACLPTPSQGGDHPPPPPPHPPTQLFWRPSRGECWQCHRDRTSRPHNQLCCLVVLDAPELPGGGHAVTAVLFRSLDAGRAAFSDGEISSSTLN